MMEMPRLHLFQISVFLVLILSGCTAIHDGVSTGKYLEMKDISYERATAGFESESHPELSEMATLDDYLAYAALHNPGLKAAFYRWKAALEKIPQVQALPDPRFTYAYFIENIETRVGPQRHRVDISQTFPWFGKLALKGDVAFEEANIQKQAYEMQKLSLFYKVETAYNEYYFLSRSVSLTEENLKLLSYFETVARTKYESGQAAYADVIKAQVELGKLEERHLSLMDMQQTMEAKLNVLLNRPPDAPLSPPVIVVEEEIALSDDEIIRRMTENNPGLKALESRIDKESQARELAGKQFYPDVMVGFGYIETGPSSMPATKDSGKDPVMTMISVNLPLWRNKYHAAVREAEIRRKSAVLSRENSENTLISEMKTALYQYRDAGRKKELYLNTLIPKARQSMNVTQSAFESGKKDFLSLIDSHRTLLEFELACERARADRETYRARVEMLAGKEL